MAVIERNLLRPLLSCGLLFSALVVRAAVLPEDRADAMLHVYDGGGVEVSGPSILVRKSIGDKVSISGNYYVDSISSASIDVITTASAYTEERTEKSLGMDYLRNKTLMSLSYTSSDESDYSATTASFNISQDFFGDLTTLSLGYAVGNDEVRNNTDTSFRESIDRQNYRLGLTQVLTKNSLLGINWETITDQGFLNNPYRQVRILENGVPTFKQEVYPGTRTSNALAMHLRWFLPYRAAISGEVRFFDDTWGIRAYNAEIGYTHPLEDAWVFDVKYRFYTQNAAEFYSDLFEQEFTYMARDKELSSFSNQTFGLGVSYEFAKGGWKFIDRGSLKLSYDYIHFDYEDFRDLSDDSAAVGEEPLYSFDANVWKAYFSVWY